VGSEGNRGVPVQRERAIRWAPYVAAAVVLGVAALAASAVPALRAARVDPAVALRAD